VATPARRAPRIRRWLLPGAVGAAVVGLAATVVVLLLRPAPAPTSPAPATTPVAEQSQPAISPTTSPATNASPSASRQHYRAYVTAAVTNGTAMAGAMANLKDCQVSRDACKQRVAEASAAAASFQHALDANPAPPCLSTTDGHLRDALTFQQRGLGLAHEAVATHNRLKLAQGLLLVGVGAWREGQAVREARQSNC
jgi:hypothetical protein